MRISTELFGEARVSHVRRDKLKGVLHSLVEFGVGYVPSDSLHRPKQSGAYVVLQDRLGEVIHRSEKEAVPHIVGGVDLAEDDDGSRQLRLGGPFEQIGSYDGGRTVDAKQHVELP